MLFSTTNHELMLPYQAVWKALVRRQRSIKC